MDVFEAMRARHSVRKYLDKPIPAEVLAKLREEVDACNREGHLHIQLVVNEPKAFDCVMARYGSFSGEGSPSSSSRIIMIGTPMISLALFSVSASIIFFPLAFSVSRIMAPPTQINASIPSRYPKI